MSRQFDLGVDEIWTALSAPDRLRRWLGKVEGDLRENGAVTIDVGAPCRIVSRILVCHPPRRLVATWQYDQNPVDEVEVRLTAEGDGTRLDLEHRSDAEGDWWFGAGSGWEFALLKLGMLLRGDDPAELSPKEFDEVLGPLWAVFGA